MLSHTVPPAHLWFTPAQLAVLLDAVQHGDHWRAACPAHGGANPTSLKIWQGTDRNGNAKTSLHCFAQGCTPAAIVATLGIPERNLYAVQEEWGKRPAGYRRTPWLEAWRKGQEPEDPNTTALMLLCEMIVSDPAWIEECLPARQKMWELAQKSPLTRARMTQALNMAGIHPVGFWQQLQHDVTGSPDGTDALSH